MLTSDQKQQIVEKFNLIESEVDHLFSSSIYIPSEIIDSILSSDSKKILDGLLLLKKEYAKNPANIITVIFMIIGSEFLSIDNKIRLLTS